MASVLLPAQCRRRSSLIQAGQRRRDTSAKITSVTEAQRRGTERNKYVGTKREFPEEHSWEDCCSGMRRQSGPQTFSCLFCSIFECLSFEADLMKSMRKTMQQYACVVCFVFLLKLK